MTAKEIIRRKHGTKGLEPMWLTLDIKQIEWLMKEYHKQQLKILNIPAVIKSVCQCTHPLSKPEKENNKCFKCGEPIK